MSLEIKLLLEELETFLRKTKKQYNEVLAHDDDSEWFHGYAYAMMQLVELLKKHDKYRFNKIW